MELIHWSTYILGRAVTAAHHARFACTVSMASAVTHCRPYFGRVLQRLAARCTDSLSCCRKTHSQLCCQAACSRHLRASTTAELALGAPAFKLASSSGKATK